MEEEKIPSKIYLDKEELIDCGYLSEVDRRYRHATKYVSVERLWHSGDETPQDGVPVLVEVVNTICAFSPFVVCKYSAKKEKYEDGCNAYTDVFSQRLAENATKQLH